MEVVEMRAARTDENQKEIVEYLRSLGALVFVTSSIGIGFVDLVVGNPEIKQIFLMEIKTRHGRLTKSQRAFHDLWQGLIYIIRTKEEAKEIYYGRSK